MTQCTTSAQDKLIEQGLSYPDPDVRDLAEATLNLAEQLDAALDKIEDLKHELSKHTDR